MDTATLAQELQKLMSTGDEAVTRKFVIEHFKDFPEETQRELAVGLFADAMAEDLAQRETLLQMKREAVETIESFQEAETEKESN